VFYLSFRPPKIISAALKAKAKAWTFEAKSIKIRPRGLHHSNGVSSIVETQWLV